jgi:hypothetical protein
MTPVLDQPHIQPDWELMQHHVGSKEQGGATPLVLIGANPEGPAEESW